MIEILVLAIALSMDAFAVSIGLGAKPSQNKRYLAISAGLYFGIFQGLMPLIGYGFGVGVFVWIEEYAPWIAFTLLAFIGGKMVYESRIAGPEEGIAKITHKVMLMLAVATSIDAMAAGFSLTLLEVNPLFACLIIAITTFVLSVLGVFIGAKSGTLIESKAELLGGIVLIILAFKLLLF